MSNDLTTLFLRVIEITDDWRNILMSSVLKRINDREDVVINWDSSVPEFWIGLNSGEEEIAVIRLNFPMVLVVRKYYETISEIFREYDVVFVVIDSFSQEYFSIDQEVLKKSFPDKLSTILDYREFTIQQLIYSTI